jgi:mannitol-1-/sugar-/sorbitol-6-/2-deoxyglucose-6-phosphatase
VPRAVVFDMDGLLVDSEPLWVRAEIEVFATVGVALREEDCALTKGLRTDDVIAYWHARRPWSDVAPRELEARLVARVAELVGQEGRALPGVASALRVAREGGRRLALASSSPSLIIGATLARLGLERAFDVVQSAEAEPLGKPHPGIFLTTAERLGVPATDCLVLEDSLTGVVAAKAARMACVAVPFDYPHQDARFALADAVVASLEHVTPELLLRFAP